IGRARKKAKWPLRLRRQPELLINIFALELHREGDESDGRGAVVAGSLRVETAVGSDGGQLEQRPAPYRGPADAAVADVALVFDADAAAPFSAGALNEAGCQIGLDTQIGKQTQQRRLVEFRGRADELPARRVILLACMRSQGERE